MLTTATTATMINLSNNINMPGKIWKVCVEQLGLKLMAAKVVIMTASDRQ